jgi:hypothetical protein
MPQVCVCINAPGLKSGNFSLDLQVSSAIKKIRFLEKSRTGPEGDGHFEMTPGLLDGMLRLVSSMMDLPCDMFVRLVAVE